MSKQPPLPAQVMCEATAALAEAGIYFEQKTAFHLKVGAFNFWPSTGAIAVDGEMARRTEKGLAAFMLLLLESGLAEPFDDTTRFIRATDLGHHFI